MGYKSSKKKYSYWGTSLLVQWLRLQVANAGGRVQSLVWELDPSKPQLRVCLLQLKILHSVQLSLVAQSCPTLCDPIDCSTPGFLVHHQLPELAQIQRPSSWWCHPTISPSVIPFSSCLQSFPASGSFLRSQFFVSGGQRIGVLSSASVLPVNMLDWFPSGLTGWSPCSPRDSHESSPTPQFKSISSSVLSSLYNPTPTSIHDYWQNHNFD